MLGQPITIGSKKLRLPEKEYITFFEKMDEMYDMFQISEDDAFLKILHDDVYKLASKEDTLAAFQKRGT